MSLFMHGDEKQNAIVYAFKHASIKQNALLRQ